MNKKLRMKFIHKLELRHGNSRSADPSANPHPLLAQLIQLTHADGKYHVNKTNSSFFRLLTVDFTEVEISRLELKMSFEKKVEMWKLLLLFQDKLPWLPYLLYGPHLSTRNQGRGMRREDLRQEALTK